MMGPLAGIFVTAFVVGLSGAMMPGPLLAVTVDESARRGAWAGPLIVAGHAMLESALVAAVALGLASFLGHPLITALIGFAGGGVMVWMGQDMIISAPRLSLREVAGRPSSLHPVLAGIIISLSNPYWILWWVTVGIGYVMIGLQFGLLGVAVFFVGHILSDLAWYSLVSVGVARGRKWISDRAYRGLMVACGIGLLGFGVWFVWTGIQVIRIDG